MPRRQHDGAASSKRGRLIAGVSADTLLLGARNPVSGKIEGFDIDMLHAVSQAIFGDPDKIELRVITAAAARCPCSRTAASTSSRAT